MEALELTALIESIDSLSSRFTWIAIVLWVVYFSVCIGFLLAWFKDKPSNVPSEFARADLMVEQGKYEELFKKSHRVLKRRPNNVEAHWYIALCYYHKSRYDKATEYFLKTKKTNPHWAEGVDVYLNYIDELENPLTESISH